MNKQKLRFNRCVTASFVLILLLLCGCTPQPSFCAPQQPADLSGVLAYATDEELIYRYPLDELGNEVRPFPAVFCSSGGGELSHEHHAAEDYYLPAGTPIYAMADGIISFSGPMGGYGWLIIIDHPQANIYSLYGHLSPSRWRLDSGSVEKGDLIAYLGDQDENGGSPEQPLRPHLHFGIRAGQRTDYPGMGEWRWQAGWIKPCPQDVGWLKPSAIITSQEITPGGFPEPKADLFEKWGVEIVLSSVYLVGVVGLLVYSIRKKNTIFPALYGSLLIVAGWFFLNKGTRLSYVLFSLAVPLFVFAIFQTIRKLKTTPATDASN